MHSFGVFLCLLSSMYLNGFATMDSVTNWNGQALFKTVGYSELPCENRMQPAACCVCKSIIKDIELHLSNNEDNLDIQVGFRLNKKRHIPYARSEMRILDVLENACDHVPLDIPKKETRINELKKVFKKSCTNFIDEMEDHILRLMFNQYESVADEICHDIMKVCNSNSQNEEPVPDDDIKDINDIELPPVKQEL